MSFFFLLQTRLSTLCSLRIFSPSLISTQFHLPLLPSFFSCPSTILSFSSLFVAPTLPLPLSPLMFQSMNKWLLLFSLWVLGQHKLLCSPERARDRIWGRERLVVVVGGACSAEGLAAFDMKSCHSGDEYICIFKQQLRVKRRSCAPHSPRSPPATSAHTPEPDSYFQFHHFACLLSFHFCAAVQWLLPQCPVYTRHQKGAVG